MTHHRTSRTILLTTLCVIVVLSLCWRAAAQNVDAPPAGDAPRTELARLQQDPASAKVLAEQRAFALSELQRPIDILVNEATSPAIKKNVYPVVGARDAIIIYPRFENDIAIKGADGRPTINIRGLEKWVQNNVPADYSDALPIDLEVDVEKWGIPMVQTVLALRPNAKVGIYGRPDLTVYGHPEPYDLASVATRNDEKIKADAALIEVSTMLFPHCYDGIPDEILTAPPYKGWNPRALKVAISRLLETGKPVGVYVWHRFHENGSYQWFDPKGTQRNQLGGLIMNPWGSTMQSSTEFVDNLRAISEATASNGARVQAVVWWGSDNYFLNAARREPDPVGYRWRAIVEAEYPDGYAPAKTDAVHEHYLRLMGEVLRGVRYGDFPQTPRFTGPVQTDPPGTPKPTAPKPPPQPPTTTPPAPSTTATNFGRFDLADEYVLDSVGVSFQPGPDFPPGGWITFQTWSDVSQSVVATNADYEAPWFYPALVLRDVPVGRAFVQALIRKQDGTRIGMVEKSLMIKPAAATPGVSEPASRTPTGSIRLSGGTITVENKAISGYAGLNAENNTRIETLTIRNCSVTTRENGPSNSGCGLYVGVCEHLIVDHVEFDIAENDNDYVYRGAASWIESSNSVYKNTGKNKATFRAYGCKRGQSVADQFIGSRMMLGGGPGNEWTDALPFENFVFRDGKIDCSTIEIYDATHHVTFENMDFKGTGHISIQNGAHDITFRNCQNIPEIRKYGDPKNVTVE